MPENVRKTLAKYWSYSLGAYYFLSFFLLLFTIMGVNDAETLGYVEDIANLMIVPCLWMPFGGIAREIENRLPKE